MGGYHDIKRASASTKALGVGSNPSMDLGGLFIPGVDPYARKESAYGGHHRRHVRAKASAVEQFRHRDA